MKSFGRRSLKCALIACSVWPSTGASLGAPRFVPTMVETGTTLKPGRVTFREAFPRTPFVDVAPAGTTFFNRVPCLPVASNISGEGFDLGFRCVGGATQPPGIAVMWIATLPQDSPQQSRPTHLIE